MRSSRSDRVVVAIFLCLAFLWALALSASPRLHERVHRDANRVDHVCAVTMLASGTYDHSASPQLVGVPDLVDQLCSSPVLTPQWVESVFLVAHIFEHAPPALA